MQWKERADYAQIEAERPSAVAEARKLARMTGRVLGEAEIQCPGVRAEVWIRADPLGGLDVRLALFAPWGGVSYRIAPEVLLGDAAPMVTMALRSAWRELAAMALRLGPKVAECRTSGTAG